VVGPVCPALLQLADLSFTPRICKQSRLLAAKVKSIHTRAEALASAKDRKMMRVRDQRDHNVRAVWEG
jgi:hypothetical protein